MKSENIKNLDFFSKYMSKQAPQNVKSFSKAPNNFLNSFFKIHNGKANTIKTFVKFLKM